MAMTPSEAAAIMGRKGGKAKTPKGFAALTPAQRSELGKAAAANRWAAQKKKKEIFRIP
jgi:hypothetical protein